MRLESSTAWVAFAPLTETAAELVVSGTAWKNSRWLMRFESSAVAHASSPLKAMRDLICLHSGLGVEPAPNQLHPALFELSAPIDRLKTGLGLDQLERFEEARIRPGSSVMMGMMMGRPWLS